METIHLDAIDYVRKARLELLTAYNLAYKNEQYQKAKFISNAINQLDGLLHIESIKKEVNA